jgi:hypothetical protein
MELYKLIDLKTDYSTKFLKYIAKVLAKVYILHISVFIDICNISKKNKTTILVCVNKLKIQSLHCSKSKVEVSSIERVGAVYTEGGVDFEKFSISKLYHFAILVSMGRES